MISEVRSTQISIAREGSIKAKVYFIFIHVQYKGRQHICLLKGSPMSNFCSIFPRIYS